MLHAPLFLLFSLLSVSLNKPSIVIIPTYEGTRLYVKLNKSHSTSYFCSMKSDWFEIWSRPLYNIFGTNCFVENFKLHYNISSNRMENTEGVQIKTLHKFGNYSSIRGLHKTLFSSNAYMDTFIDHIEQMGFKSCEDLFVASYDFRLIGETKEMEKYFKKLTELIEKIYSSKNSRILLLSHGLGGPIISHFLRLQPITWKNKFIHSWISISGTFGGTFLSLQAHMSGLESFFSTFLSLSAQKRIQTTFPSIYFQFPSDKVFPKNKVAVKVGNRSYTISELKEFISDYDVSNISNILPNIPNIFSPGPLGVRLICIYGSGFNTSSGLVYKYASNPNHFSHIYENGDGYSTTASLEACTQFKDARNKNFLLYSIPNVTYTSILKHPRFLKVFDSLVSLDETH